MKWSRLILMIIVIAVLAAFGVRDAVVWRADSLSRPKVVIPQGNRQSFARVAILIDGTRSVGSENFAVIKEIVQSQIIPSLGVNDTAVCFEVQPDFSEERNAVFGLDEDQPPQELEEHRERVLDLLDKNRDSSQRGVVEDTMYGLIRTRADQRKRVEEVHSLWAQQVQTREQPKREGSDICTPLKAIGAFLSDGDPAAERWLFVLSDLENDTGAPNCQAEESFPEANIRLIYPFQSDSPKWESVVGFWQAVFEDRELKRVSFTTARVDGALLPPNPTAGLEKIEVRTVEENVQSLSRPAFLAWLGLTLVGAVTAAYFCRRKPVFPSPTTSRAHPAGEGSM